MMQPTMSLDKGCKHGSSTVPVPFGTLVLSGEPACIQTGLSGTKFPPLPSSVEGVAQCTRQAEVNTTVATQRSTLIICKQSFC